MNRSAIKISTLCFLVSVTIVAYFLGRHRIIAWREAGAAASSRRNNEIERLRVENNRLKTEEKDLASRSAIQKAARAVMTSLSLSDAAHFEALRLLGQSRGMFTHGLVNIRPGANGRLPAGFGDLFRLHPADFIELQETLDKTKQQLDERSLAGTTVRREGNGVVVMEVGAVPEWPQMREALAASFQRILGPERYSTFLTLLPNGMDSIFDGFSRDERRITLEYNPTFAGNGQSRYNFYLQVSADRKFTRIVNRDLVGTSGGMSESSGDSVRTNRWAAGINASEVTQRLGLMAQLVPADFWK